MRIAVAMLAVLLLEACGSPRFVGSAGVRQVEQLDAVPVRASPDEFNVRIPYRIGPYDRLQFVLVGLDPSSGEAVVDTSGNISIPMVGPVRVGGLTTQQAEAAIAEGLRRNHVKEPIVSLNVLDIKSQTVTVEGSVKKPGQYPATNATTLLRAIASAEGQSEFARNRDVVVFRTVNGQNYAALYDLNAIRTGAYPDPYLNPGDVVVIDEERSKRYFRDVLSSVPALLSPIIVLLTRN